MNKRILGKIKKLLALAASGNQHEAAKCDPRVAAQQHDGHGDGSRRTADQKQALLGEALTQVITREARERHCRRERGVAERGLVEVQAELGRYLLAWKSSSQDRIGAMFWLETAAI